jgi:hypothetical protein
MVVGNQIVALLTSASTLLWTDTIRENSLATSSVANTSVCSYWTRGFSVVDS